MSFYIVKILPGSPWYSDRHMLEGQKIPDSASIIPVVYYQEAFQDKRAMHISMPEIDAIILPEEQRAWCVANAYVTWEDY